MARQRNYRIVGILPSVNDSRASCHGWALAFTGVSSEGKLLMLSRVRSTGSRIKLIAAAAKGRVIVTATLGCEGLGLVDGVHAEIVDNPADFAAGIVALARVQSRHAELAEAALAHAEQEFSADKFVADLKEKIRLALASSGSV